MIELRYEKYRTLAVPKAGKEEGKGLQLSTYLPMSVHVPFLPRQVVIACGRRRQEWPAICLTSGVSLGAAHLIKVE
jgi:hypothetical protein